MPFANRTVTVYAVSLLFLSLVPCLSGFGIHPTRHSLLSTTFHEAEHFLTLRMAGDFPEQDEIYKGTVDWDEEWKKVVRGQGQPKERPSGNPKSDLEKVAVKAQREAEATIYKVKTQAKKAVNVRSLQNDWKFWIALLVGISVATSLISASSQSGQIYTPESYYI